MSDLKRILRKPRLAQLMTCMYVCMYASIACIVCRLYRFSFQVLFNDLQDEVATPTIPYSIRIQKTNLNN